MITQLELDQRLKADGRFFKRKIKNLRTQIRRQIRSGVRHSRSSYMRWYRRQYFLTSAYADMKKGISKNEDIYITAIIIAVVLGYSYAVVAAEMIHMFFLTAYILAETSGSNMLFLSLFTAAIVVVTLSWVGAFALNAMSIAQLQGANRKVLRSVRKTTRQALRYSTRTTSAWFLVLAEVARPMAIAILISLAFLKAGVMDGDKLLLAAPIAAILLGLLWSVNNLLRYTLVPHVLLFEPALRYDEAFKKSADLVRRKGKIFLATFYLTIISLLALAYLLTGFLEDKTGINRGVTFLMLAAAMIIFSNGLLVAFYRKRKLARSN